MKAIKPLTKHKQLQWCMQALETCVHHSMRYLNAMPEQLPGDDIIQVTRIPG